MRTIGASLGILSLCTAGSTSAALKGYSGAFIGVSISVGPNILSNPDFEHAVGMSTKVEARVASVLQLIDVATFYALSTTGFAPTGGERRFTGHGFGMKTALHPMFLAHLGNRTLNYIMGSFHVAFGAAGEWRTLSGASSADEFSLGWQWGLGVDVPIQNPNFGRSFWIGVRYTKWNRDFKTAGALRDQDAHALLLRLEHRWNGFPGF